MMIRPVMVVTMVLATLAIMIIASQLINLNAEIVSGAGIEGHLSDILALPTHTLLLCAVLPGALAIVGIWRRFR